MIDFSAKEPLLGYLYQISYSLFLLLDCEERNQPEIRIENLDDIEIADKNSIDLLQTKFHVKSLANLTDASPDFWKTIRIWAELIKSNKIDLNNTIFNLVTTQSISNTSILKSFAQNGSTKNTDIINDELERIAVNSNNKENKPAYESYLSLNPTEKEKLISNITIIDNSIDFESINLKIKQKIKNFIHPNKLDSFIERLEGWWWRKCLGHIQGQSIAITGDELANHIFDIQDTFAKDNLPADFLKVFEITEEELSTYTEQTFVRQLELITLKTNSEIVKNAISDFRRAYEQRSKWLRENLLNTEEEETFNDKLYDYWKKLFNILEFECDDVKGHDVSKICREYYFNFYVKTTPDVRIRERFSEEYLTRGSFHMLSDLKRIGWHINYKNIL